MLNNNYINNIPEPKSNILHEPYHINLTHLSSYNCSQYQFNNLIFNSNLDNSNIIK